MSKKRSKLRRKRQTSKVEYIAPTVRNLSTGVSVMFGGTQPKPTHTKRHTEITTIGAYDEK